MVYILYNDRLWLFINIMVGVVYNYSVGELKRCEVVVYIYYTMILSGGCLKI